MDFQISEEIAAVCDTARAFIDKDVVPLEREMVGRPFRELLPRLGELRARARALGLWAASLPREVGGAGLSLAEFAHLSEVLGRTPLGHYVCNSQAPDIGNMELLLAHGSEAQRACWLAPLVAGQIRSCFSMTEPGYPGSNPAWMGTTAVRDGDDYVINGDKWFSTGADGAAFTIVMAITNEKAPSPYLRASQIIVPTDNPGFRLVRNTSVMGHEGDDYASHAEVSFVDCRVPVENRVGAEGAGFILAQERLGPGRIHHCMRWIGICERAFDLMCEHAVGRMLAPNRPLATRQVVQHWVADSRAEIDAARLLVLRTAWEIERSGSHAAREQISAIKYFVANTMARVLDRAIQTHGGLGLTDYTPLAWWYRQERAARIYDGADEVHRGLVGRKILERYGLQRRQG
jgi:alkylation response protein AidB-like acyl-CoA dehydrogenase